MTIDPLLLPDRFVGIEDVAHLCTGGEGPWLKAQSPIYDEFARLKGEGSTGRATIYEANAVATGWGSCGMCRPNGSR